MTSRVKLSIVIPLVSLTNKIYHEPRSEEDVDKFDWLMNYWRQYNTACHFLFL